MESTVLQPFARLLVFLHAASAIVLIGSTSHHFLVARGYLRGTYKTRLGRIYAATSATAYATAFLLGSLAYPTYRYHVRGLYLDRYAVWASNLFDIKENLASLGLVPVLGALVLSRVMDPREDRALVRGYAAMVFSATVVVWFNVIAGLFVTMAKGV